MITKYRTAFWVDKDVEELTRQLQLLGIFLNFGNFEAVQFFDNDIHFNEIKSLFEYFDISLSKESIYTEEERNDSDYLELLPTWHHGYPQPEEGYKELCYDVKEFCTVCGIGAKQIKSLQMRAEPKWGRREMMQLNWVFDEYFSTPQLFAETFKPLVDYTPVVQYKKNKQLSTVVQLNIPIIETELIMNNYPFEICMTCNRKKYLPITVGGCPHLSAPIDLPIFKSKEYFGSGASANRMVFVNNILYKQLVKRNVKGISFTPMIK